MFGTTTAFAGGLVADGVGGEPYPGDVIVRDGVIAEIVARGSATTGAYGPSVEVVDCSGRIVAPGFVDIHCHSDLSLLAYPSNESRVTQGITTEVVGNCGMTPAPSGGDNAGLAGVIGTINVVPNLPWSWQDLRGWLDLLDATPTATNIATHVGHGSARFVAAGATAHPLDAAGRAALEAQLESALDEGCVGVSLGLMYSPGEGADREELVQVGKIVARRNGLLSAHLRDYAGERLLASVDEIIDVARASDARVQISHLRYVGDGDVFARAIERIEAAREHLDIAADSYPYIAGHTNLIQLLPTEIRGLGAPAIAQLCREDPAAIGGLLAAAGFAPQAITIMKAPATTDAVGRNAAEATGDPWRALVDLLIANDGNVDAAVVGSHWADVDLGYSVPWMSVASDGTALSPGHTASMPHPRSWGAFPSAYRRMRALDIPVGEAVRRMTSGPAARAGLSATLSQGAPADVVVFDEVGLAATDDYARPSLPATGIDHVYVRGVPVLHNGTTTGNLPGRLIKGKHSA